jgi:hypothetical protein
MCVCVLERLEGVFFVYDITFGVDQKPIKGFEERQ